MKITIDSGEPLHDALRVVGALYDVELVVSEDRPAARAPRTSSKPRSTPAAPKATRPARSKKTPRAKVSAPPRASAPRSSAGKRSAATKSSTPVSTLELRSWARQNGFTVSERGRVATKVIAAYRAAHEA